MVSGWGALPSSWGFGFTFGVLDLPSSLHKTIFRFPEKLRSLGIFPPVVVSVVLPIFCTSEKLEPSLTIKHISNKI